MPKFKPKTLLDILKERGVLSAEKAELLEEEAKRTGRSAEDVIWEKGNIEERAVVEAKSELLKIPFRMVDADEKIPIEALEIVPEEAARYYNIIPLAKRDDFLEVGMVNPDDVRAQEALKFIVQSRGLAAKIFIITPSDFSKAMAQYRSLRGEVKAALQELEKELEEKKPPVPTAEVAPAEAASRISEEAPIIKMVGVMLKHAVEGRASDIHVEPERDRLRIRFRVDGILYNSLFLPIHIHPAVISRIKILSNLKIDETRVPQDGRFRVRIEDRDIDFRVSTFPTQSGEKAALRILDPTVGIKTLDDLGLESRNRRVLERALKKPFGMILLTGPTGSGKTTTLYASMQVLNKESVNVISLEDPVEYFISGLNQSQVRPEIGYDFAQGLRHVLRQDPDIIMVGEIRDNETAALAIHAALTGHIVLSTLHTNNSIGVIPRLIDMKVEPFLLPAALNLAAAQRLLKKLCDSCKKQVEAAGEKHKVIEKEIAEMPKEIRDTMPSSPYKIYEPVGCPKCANKGTLGRLAVFEMLEMTPELEQIVLSGPSETKITAEAKRQGMLTMKQDGIIKALKGLVSVEEVLTVVEE